MTTSPCRHALENDHEFLLWASALRATCRGSRKFQINHLHTFVLNELDDFSCRQILLLFQSAGASGVVKNDISRSLTLGMSMIPRNWSESIEAPPPDYGFSTLLPKMNPISAAARGWFWFMPAAPKASPGAELIA